MKKESLLSREELALLFPNLPDLIEIHSKPLRAWILFPPGNNPLQWEQRVADGCPRLLRGHPPFGPALLTALYRLAAPASPFPLLGAIQSLFFPGFANARCLGRLVCTSPWRSTLSGHAFGVTLLDTLRPGWQQSKPIWLSAPPAFTRAGEPAGTPWGRQLGGCLHGRVVGGRGTLLT